jgi:hypothetical protein
VSISACHLQYKGILKGCYLIVFWFNFTFSPNPCIWLVWTSSSQCTILCVWDTSSPFPWNCWYIEIIDYLGVLQQRHFILVKGHKYSQICTRLQTRIVERSLLEIISKSKVGVDFACREEVYGRWNELLPSREATSLAVPSLSDLVLFSPNSGSFTDNSGWELPSLCQGTDESWWWKILLGV